MKKRDGIEECLKVRVARMIPQDNVYIKFYCCIFADV